MPLEAPLQEAVHDLADAVARMAPTSRLVAATEALQIRLDHATPGQAQLVLDRLAEIAAGADLSVAAPVLLCCGALVEAGRDFARAGRVILQRGKEAFAVAARNQRALQAAWDRAESAAGGRLGEQQLQAAADAALAGVPRGQLAVGSQLSSFAAPLLAVLLRSKAARKATRGHPSFRDDIAHFRHFGDRPEALLGVVLDVLDDEELLVLHPRTGRGYRVSISGITHNFQLHTLLADALIGDDARDLLPGTRPDPRVVAAAGSQPFDPDRLPAAEACFHLQDWTAVQPDGSVNDDPFAHVVWHEGRPADVPAFEGTRVLLLSPVTVPRSWRAPRDFAEMAGEARVVGILTPDEVRDWLRRLAEAPRPPAGDAVGDEDVL